MSIGNTLKATYSFRFFHLFPTSKKYREMSDNLKLSSSSLSSFLFSLRLKEGRKSLILSNLLYSLSALFFALFLDFYLKDKPLEGKGLLLVSFLYTLFLAVKFGFIRARSFREPGEVVFSFLSFYFTHYFLLPLLLVILFENAEALSAEDKI